MAHVYWNERASRYYMRYSGAAPGGGRKWRTKAAPETWTKKQAEAMAHELERGAEMGEATAADVEVATLADLCGWWLEHWCKPASVKRERSRLSVNVMGRALGATPLKKVTPQLIEARLREMERDGAASASVEHVRRTLRRIFNCARKSKVWTVNPAAEASPRSMDSKRPPTTLNPNEVVSVIQATPTPWKRELVAVALGTGMRKGELLGLRKTSGDSSGSRSSCRGPGDSPSCRPAPRPSQPVRARSRPVRPRGEQGARPERRGNEVPACVPPSLQRSPAAVIAR